MTVLTARRTNWSLAACSAGLLLGLGSASAQSPLDVASAKRSVESQQLVRKGADVNAKSADGSTALHFAARAGDEALVTALLKAGADANVANRYGVTPLMEAAASQPSAVAALLLKAGANPNVSIGKGESILMTAARTGNAPAVEALLSAGADANAREGRRGQTALMMAAAKGHAAIVRLMVTQGADKDARDLPVNRTLGRVIQAGGPPRPPAGGMTAMLFAAREGQAEAVTALLDAGTDVNQTEGEGWTALLLAIANTHYGLAAKLIERGANPNLANEMGLLPLYATVEMRLPDITNRPLRPERDDMTSLQLIDVLLKAGANPNGRIEARQNVVALPTGAVAAGPGPTAAVAGIGVGGTAFMRAVRGGDLDTMKLLLKYGADPKATRTDGTNAIMIAGGIGRAGFGATAQTRSREELLEAIRLCQEAGLDINALNAGGLGALHGAAAAGDIAMIRILVDAGAKLDLKNRDGLTPLDVAEGKGPAVRGRPPQAQPEAADVLRQLVGHNTQVAGSF
jgi:uncharacterized protein